MKPLLPDNLEKNLLVLLLSAMAILMPAAAFCRHLFPQYHRFPLAAAAFCLAWLASLGMARAATLGLHTRVTAFAALSPDAVRTRLDAFADAAFLLFAVILLITGCAATLAAVNHPNAPGHPLVLAALPAGSALTIVRLLQRLLRRPASGEQPAGECRK